MTKLLRIAGFLSVLLIFAQRSDAQPPPVPVDSVSISLKATGAPKSGDITASIAVSTSLPNNTVNIKYFQWNGTNWVASGFTSTFQVPIVTTVKTNQPMTLFSGQYYYAQIDLVRGGVVVTTANSNAVLTP